MVSQQPRFEQAVRLFEIYCRSKGLAERTQETYKYALNLLRGHLKSVAGR